MGARRHADRAGHRRRDLPGPAPRPGRWRRFPGSGWSTTAPSTIPRRGRATRRALAAPPVRRPAGRRSRRRARSCCSTRPASPASAGSTSSTTPPSRRRPCCGPGGDAGVIRVPGTGFGLAVTRGLQQPAGRARSVRGRQGGRGGGGPQRRLHRGRAARHHRLPQLRQPGKARGVLPVPRGLPRHRGRLPGLRHSGDRGKRLASTTRAPPARWIPTPDDRHGRPAGAGRGAGAEPLRRPGRRGRACWGTTRGDLGGSAYWAEVCDFVGGPAAPCRSRGRAPAAAAPGRGRRAAAAPLGPRLLPRAGWPWRWRRRRSAGPTCRAAWAPRSTSTGYAPGRAARRAALRRGRRPGGRLLRPGRRSRLLIALADEHGVPVFHAGRVGSAGGALELRVGARLFSLGHRSPTADLFRGDSPSDAAPRRGSLGGSIAACAASSACPAFPTRPG